MANPLTRLLDPVDADRDRVAKRYQFTADSRAWLVPLAIGAALFTLGTAGCDSGGTDEPLPSFEELRRDFAGQPPGRGLVREDGDDAYETSAIHYTNREVGPQGSISTFRVRLEGETRNARVTLIREGIAGTELEPGTQFEGVGVLYGGPGCAGSGSGRLEVTSVRDSLVAGVFAADASTTTLVPCNRRLTGGFTAIFDPLEVS
jgi:hypothetical protein